MIGERVGCPARLYYHIDQAVKQSVHHGTAKPLVRRLVLGPLQCNSARYNIRAKNIQGESHHSLRSIDPAPNPTLRID